MARRRVLPADLVPVDRRADIEKEQQVKALYTEHWIGLAHYRCKGPFTSLSVQYSTCRERVR